MGKPGLSRQGDGALRARVGFRAWGFGAGFLGFRVGVFGLRVFEGL